MALARTVAIIVFLFLPAAALAAGPHAGVGCAGCHMPQGAKGALPRPTDPPAKQPNMKSSALCLGCHEDTPVSRHTSHPFGLATVNPRVARVPQELLRDGRFECLGCHDPHPSNGNYKYLRVDVGPRGEKLDRFCAVCHPSKTDPAAVAGAHGP